MIDYSNIGEDGIVKDGIFNRFEILRPAFLDNYWNNPKHRKLMIVAESNYFKDGTDSIYKDPQTWYLGEDEPVKQFLEKQKKSLSNWKEYKTFSKLCKSMNEISGLQCNSVYEEAIFYNYFLRPATVLGANRSFEKDCTQLDREVAGAALCGILKREKPDIVIFASKYAFNEFEKFKLSAGFETDIIIDFVIHPASPNWSKSEDGKQKFEHLLKQYWIK